MGCKNTSISINDEDRAALNAEQAEHKIKTGKKISIGTILVDAWKKNHTPSGCAEKTEGEENIIPLKAGAPLIISPTNDPSASGSD